LAADLISSFALERLPRAPVRVREQQVREWLKLEQM